MKITILQACKNKLSRGRVSANLHNEAKVKLAQPQGTPLPDEGCYRILEDGSYRLLEDSSFRLLEQCT